MVLATTWPINAATVEELRTPDLKGLNVTNQEMAALEFLYAYMPLADVTDYPTSYFLDNVRSSLRTREEMSWGRQVPELLFRHFVLPVRVNNESLDRSRMEFYAILKERVRGMTMQEIANDLDFPNASFFGKYVKDHLGMTPMEYRKKYQNQ